jgi:hypothetical protein
MSTAKQREQLVDSGGKSQSTPMRTTAVGVSQPVAALQSSYPQSAVKTLQFEVIPPPLGVPAFGEFNCEAIIQWQNCGNKLTRRISVGNGASISGTGQGVTVQLQDVTAFPPGNQPYQVTTSLSPGQRASYNQPPTLLGFKDGVHTVLAGGALVLNIPQDAGAISLEVSIGVLVVAALPVTGKINVILETAVGVIFKQYDPAVEIGFVPIPPNCSVVVINNFDAAHSYRIQVTFGIDG